MPGIRKFPLCILYLGAILFATIYILNHDVLAGEKTTLKKIPVFMMGDRLLDITHSLGYAPEALATRCTSKAGEKFASISVKAGCPGRMLRDKAEAFNSFCEENELSRLVMEKSMLLCSNDNKSLSENLGIDKKIEISQIDFSQGIPKAIEQTAAILGCPEKGKKLARDYEARLSTVMSGIDKNLAGKKILVLYGIYNSNNNKSFLQTQGNMGDEQSIVKDLGMINAAKDMAPKKEALRGIAFMSPRLRNLEQAKPDFIVIMGHSFAAQKEIRKWVKKNGAKAKLVPAIRDNAIFTLPPVEDQGTLLYPKTLKLWNWALSNQ